MPKLIIKKSLFLKLAACSFILYFLFGCTTPLQMPAQKVSQIEHDEGIVFGSVLIKGGKESAWDKIPVLGLGSKTWNLSVVKMDSPPKTFSINAEERGEEAVFVTKMPAGEYRFVRFEQKLGNSTLYANIDVPFTVQPAKTVYIGRLIIEFPLEHVRGGTRFSQRVEDAKEHTLALVEETHGEMVSNSITDLMGEYHLEKLQTFEKVWYRPGKKGFSLKAYSHRGMLTVGEEAFEFSCKEKQLTVPHSSIVNVQWGKLGMDFVNEWAIVTFSVGGTDEVAAFKDGKQLGHGRYSRKIYKSIEKAFLNYKASEEK